MLLSRRVVSASGRPRREIVFPAVPMTVDSVKAPASSPAAVPASYPMTFAATTVVTRLTTHRTRVSSAWDAAFFLQPAEELRPDLVAGGEEEEREEDRLDERVDLHVELADEDAGEERPHHVAESEAPDARPADHEADGQGQEDRQLGVLAKRRDEPVHGWLLGRR